MNTDTLNIEKKLLRQIAGGDEKAFRILFDQYKNRFYAVVLKMTGSDDTAQEIVQEVFFNIWKQRTSMEAIDTPDAYFFTLVYRQVYKHYKKMALERKLLKVIAEGPAFENNTDEAVIANESSRLINEAVAQLPPQQQMIFKLSKQDGLSRQQIAEQLNLSPNTVRNHLAEAIKSIRNYISNSGLSYALLLLLLKY